MTTQMTGRTETLTFSLSVAELREQLGVVNNPDPTQQWAIIETKVIMPGEKNERLELTFRRRLIAAGASIPVPPRTDP